MTKIPSFLSGQEIWLSSGPQHKKNAWKTRRQKRRWPPAVGTGGRLWDFSNENMGLLVCLQSLIHDIYGVELILDEGW